MPRLLEGGFASLAALLVILFAGPAFAQRAQPGDPDKTLLAMRDELARSKDRLQIAGLEKPFYV